MDHSDLTRLTEINRRAWDAVARTRGDGLRPAESFAAGVGNFDPTVLAIAHWHDLDVLHLQCASGEDTLTLALAGARVTGVDISTQNVTHARRKSSAAGVPGTFVVADVYDLPADLLACTFDVVFTGSGALCWLPDIARWAEVVVAALRDGGRLLVEEMHPLRGCFDVAGDHVVATDQDYFQRASPREVPGGPARLAGAGGAYMPENVQFRWPIGDVVTALARAGMRIDLLDEYFCPPARDDIPSHVLAQLRRLPNDFTLLATKDPLPRNSLAMPADHT